MGLFLNKKGNYLSEKGLKEFNRIANKYELKIMIYDLTYKKNGTLVFLFGTNKDKINKSLLALNDTMLDTVKIDAYDNGEYKATYDKTWTVK